MQSASPNNSGSLALSRRRLLQVGGLGIFGLGLPQFLQASNPAASGKAHDGPPKSCIFVFMAGGPSHVDLFDPKPEAPREIRGPYRPIATSASGIQMGELLPQLAKQAHRFCLLRTLTHTSPGHFEASQDLWAGKSKSMANHPGLGSFLSKLRPSSHMPSYVWLNQLTWAAPASNNHRYGGYLGTAHAPLEVGGPGDHPALASFRFKGFDRHPSVAVERMQERWQLLEKLDTSLTEGAPAAMRSFQEKALDLTIGARAREAFLLDREPDRLRDRYGREALGQNLLLARRLIEAGVRLVAVNAAPSDERGNNVSSVCWDMHPESNGGTFATRPWGLGWVAPRFDNAVSALLEDLANRGLLDSTLVVVMGEMGRTPRIEDTGARVGRNHWHVCYSGILAGAGIRGGCVYGTSDKYGAHIKDRPMSLENLGATLFHALGVDPESHITGVDGTPRPVSTGQPVMEIIS